MKLMDIRTCESLPRWRQCVLAAKRLTYLVHQYHWAARVHAMMAHNEKYHLFRFEDTIQAPEDQMKKLCNFLAVPFDKRMLLPRMEDSSFRKREITYGFDVCTLERWRNVISPYTDRIIRKLLGREMRLLGYG